MNRTFAVAISLTAIVGVYFAFRAAAHVLTRYRTPQRRLVPLTAPMGVGGWLALFILSLVVGNPWMTLYSYGREAVMIRELSGEFPGLLTMQAASLTHVIAGILFSVVAGVYLYRGTFRGYIAAREFLIFSLTGTICSLGLPLLSGMSSEAILTMIRFQLAHTSPQSVVYFLIWWLYLSRSDRVYRTYIEPSDAANPKA